MSMAATDFGKHLQTLKQGFERTKGGTIATEGDVRLIWLALDQQHVTGNI